MLQGEQKLLPIIFFFYSNELGVLRGSLDRKDSFDIVPDLSPIGEMQVEIEGGLESDISRPLLD